MSARKVPPEVIEAVERHFRTFHPHVAQRRVGSPNSRSSSASATWTPASDGESEMFACRLCPQGRNRYSIEVDAPSPSQRILRTIRAHFANEHGIHELPRDEVNLLGEEDRGQKAVWEPATLVHGAGFGCMLCPPGQHVFLEPPPYGDAGRLNYLLFERPELQRETVGLTPEEEAEYLELADRGLLLQAQTATARALALTAMRHAGAEPLRAPRQIEPLIQQILLERVQGGEHITAVIDELARLSSEKPKAFTLLLGAQIKPLRSDANIREIAQFLGYKPGGLPAASKSTLWNYWKRIPNSLK